MQNQAIYNEAPTYCHHFFDLVVSNDLIDELKKSKLYTFKILEKISPENENYAYQNNKWTTKEVIKHIIDCERIYAYRALRFSRFDETELTGFDQNNFIANCNASMLSLTDLKEEYNFVRESSIQLFKSMTEEMLSFKGKANQSIFTARSLGFLSVGHNLHHCYFLEKNYLF